MRVLVVDDHRNTRESLALGLSVLGHEPDVADSASEALSRLEERTYCWLICDVRMPGTNGVEFAPVARRTQPDLGLILMTAYDVSEEERRVIDALGALLVIKPVTAATLASLCAARTEHPLDEEPHR